MDLDVSSLASSGRDVVQTTLPRPHQDASQRVHPGPFDPSAEDAAFFGQVTRSTPGQFVIPQGRPGNQALRSALRTESQAIFIHMAPLLEYARDTFDVARAVITVFRKDTLELYDGDEVRRRQQDIAGLV